MERRNYEDSIIDGLKVTQVETENKSSRASIKGNRLLIKWGKNQHLSEFSKDRTRTKWVKWAQRKLAKKAKRIEQKKTWTRTRINGYSLYDLDQKEEVANIMAAVEKDILPLLQSHPDLRYNKMKESVAEGSLGFNRGAGRVIALNIRQKANPFKLRKHSAIIKTMIHELAHIRHMNHGQKFWELNDELMKEAREKGIYQPN